MGIKSRVMIPGAMSHDRFEVVWVVSCSSAIGEEVALADSSDLITDSIASIPLTSR